MRLSSLSGPPVEIESYIPLQKEGYTFFWCEYKGRKMLCEKRTGALVFLGSLSETKEKLRILFDSRGTMAKRRINSWPSVDELHEARKELIQLHSQYRRLTKEKLPRILNKGSWAGDLYVPHFPEVASARLKKIINNIKTIQNKEFTNERNMHD